MRQIERFLKAQQLTYQQALSEVKNGKKENHWMWYIFPQILGLGKSSMAIFYSINDLEEAKEYLENEILGNRLIEITNELLNLETNDPTEIFGDIDSLKLNSCMTLFDYISEKDNVFKKVIDKFYYGNKDDKTIEICNEMSKNSLVKSRRTL